MDNFILGGIVVTLVVFIGTLGLRNTNSSKKSLKKHKIYGRLTTVSIVLFFIFLLLWQFYSE